MEEFTISLELPADEDGFLDRQCYFAECGQFFKVLGCDIESRTITSMTCPFCGTVGEPEQFNTDDQNRYLEELGAQIIQEKMQELLGGLSKSVNRRQSRNSFLSMKMTTKFSPIPVPVSPEAMESMRLQIACDSCGATYAVIGAGFFCPLCGKNSARHTLFQSINKTRNVVKVQRSLASSAADPDEMAQLKRDTLENQINNLVTTFQRYGEASYSKLPQYSKPPSSNLFQRLDDATDKWEAAGGRRFENILDQSEWADLKKYFQRRHVLSHQDGNVDEKYVAKSGETTYKAGQRFVVKESHVLRMADLVEKLTRGMEDDIPDEAKLDTATPSSSIEPAFPDQIPGVTEQDWKVYRLACEAAEAVDHNHVDGRGVWLQAQAMGLSEEEFGDSLEILESKSLLRGDHVISSEHIPIHIAVRSRGLELYFRAILPDFDAHRRQVASALVDGSTSSDRIVELTGLSKLFIHFVLKDFESRQWVGKIMWTAGIAIVPVTRRVHLKRLVGEGNDV